MAKVIFLAFHGIGTYRDDDGPNVEYRPFFKEIFKRTEKKLGSQAADIVWQPVYWSNGPLHERQANLLEEQRDAGRARGFVGRHIFSFAIGGLGDAAGYQLPNPHQQMDWEAYSKSGYAEVQFAVRRAIQDAIIKAGGDDSIPVVATAQSMGCHVLSSYAWDAEWVPERVTGDPSVQLSPVERLQTLTSVTFTGCNIPILTMSQPRNAKYPLKIRKDAGGSWLNFYDKDDVLGYPIEPEYASYFGTSDEPFAPTIRDGRDPSEEVKPQDRRVSVGNLLTGWNAASHVDYDEEDEVIDAITEQLRHALSL